MWRTAEAAISLAPKVRSVAAVSAQITQTGNSSNCSGCGKPCTGGKICQGGACVNARREQTTAPAHASILPVTCTWIVDRAANNCATSGMQCQEDGSCVCPPGQNTCSGKCVDLQGDKQNCGACGNSCPMDKTCQNGACVCPSGKTDCGGPMCVDLQSDKQNCGSCSTPLPDRQDVPEWNLRLHRWRRPTVAELA